MTLVSWGAGWDSVRSGRVLEAIGGCAAFCTTVSFVPQLVRVWRRKSADDISLIMFLLFSFGVLCWLVYGIGIGSLPMIAANVVTLMLALAILILKLRFSGTHSRMGNDKLSP